MANEETTHVIYQGKHWELPGKLTPEDAFIRVKNLSSNAPRLKAGAPSTGAQWPDTSGDVARIQETYREPNRARDVLPRLAEFALVGSAPAGIGSAVGRGVATLRGLSGAQKAATVAKTAGTAAAYGAAGMAADRGLQAVGVPAGVSELAVTAAGLGGTRPGRAAVRAGLKALAGTEAAAAPAAAAKVAATADEIAAQIVKWKTEQGFSGAQVVSSLRNVYGIPPKDGNKMLQMVTESAGLSSLRTPRIQEGAQRVGRSVGMTKEEVRKVTGPVVGEKLGEASPIIPTEAWKRIVTDMKALPKTGGLREAYVARASAGKNRGQVEQLRRTLEHLGLLLPLGAAGAAVSE